MSNPKFEIECMMWNQEKVKDKWEIVDSENGNYSIIPDLANLKVENHEVIIDDPNKEAYRIVNGQRQDKDYNKTKRDKEYRAKFGRAIQKVKEVKDNERAQ